nr:MAG: hypothetical protein [Bacteriophage sp.]
MKVDYVHKDTLTATDYVELNKNNELLVSYNQALLKENQELKKQLEDKEDYINKLQATKDKWDYENTMQQKEFIRYLKEKEKQFDMIGDPINSGACCGILNKYKEIIGDDK